MVVHFFYYLFMVVIPFPTVRKWTEWLKGRWKRRNNPLPILSSSSLEFLLFSQLNNASLKSSAFDKNRAEGARKPRALALSEKIHDILFGRNTKFIVTQKHLWRLHELGKLGLIISHRMDLVWTEISAHCSRTENPQNQTATGFRRIRLIFFSARDASLHPKEQSLEVGTAGGAFSHSGILLG